MNHLLNVLLACLVSTSIAMSQALTVTGSVVDDSARTPLPGANVMLTNTVDTTVRLGAVAARNGGFAINNVGAGTYRLRASYLGYTTLEKLVVIRRGSERLGTIELAPSSVAMREVVIESRVPPVEQKADTLQFNAAGFKTNPDATAEELVTKLPGVTVTQGQVKHQGEDVKKTLVDGRPFFGDDAAIAMRNLPADVIDKVQIYDKRSDQAELTGFDDGQSEKTINFITRATRRSGLFGRAYAGYGTIDRYTAGGNFNYFADTMRVSLIGLSNNVNQQNFSIMDLLGSAGVGGGGRGGGLIAQGMRMLGVGRGGAVDNMVLNMAGRGGSSFFVGQMSGLTTTNSIGTNFNDEWNGTVKASASYFFNHTNNTNDQITNRQYFIQGGADQFYDESSSSTNRSGNHRINARIEYYPDTLNTLYFMPRFSLQSTTSSSLLASSMMQGLATELSSSSSASTGDADVWNAGGGLTWKHRFGPLGRSIVLNLSGSGNNRVGDSYLDAHNRFITPVTTVDDTVTQKTTTKTKGYSFSGDVSYTEQFGSSALLLVNYGASWSDNQSDRRTWSYDYFLRQYGLLEPGLSSVLDNGYLTQRGGLGMRLRGEGWNSLVQVNYQLADLTGDQTFPFAGTIDRSFRDILPSAQLDWRFSTSGNIRLNYRTSTTPPSVTQLQNAVDNSNPLVLSTGNPGLRQDYSHNLFLRFGQTNIATLSGFFVFLSGGITSNYIGTSTTIAQRDTVLDGITLQRGAQLTRPVNLDGYRNLRAMLTWSQPVALISSNLTLTGGVMYARTPGMTNDITTLGNSYAVNAGTVIASNISQDFDFTISYMATENILRNAVGTTRSSDYFSHNASVRLNWIFWEGMVLRGDLTHTFTNGLGAGYDQDFLLLNGSIGRKFFSDQSLEISLNVFDLLNRNSSAMRYMTEAYIENVRPTVLGRHVLLTASYTLRSFTGSQPPPGGPPRGFPGMGPGHGPGRDF